jgi:hypothetical protein
MRRHHVLVAGCLGRIDFQAKAVEVSVKRSDRVSSELHSAEVVAKMMEGKDPRSRQLSR